MAEVPDEDSDAENYPEDSVDFSSSNGASWKIGGSDFYLFSLFLFL